MTDKELKKLSRFELLELLLTESRENDRLREELKRVKKENTVEKSAKHLNETSKELNSALKKVSSMLSGIDISAIADLNNDTADENYESDSPETPDLQEANKLIAAQKANEATKTETEQKPEEQSSQKEKTESAYKSVDYNIYKNLMVFFIKNPYSLAVLPDDLRKDITDRIDDIKSKLKEKSK